jgi:mono/diheme cytochrome c family protein
MARRGLLIGGVCVVAAAAAAWIVVAPRGLKASEVAAPHQANLANGEAMFMAGNCSGCHAQPGQNDFHNLAGGLKLSSTFGDFVVPNISSDRQHGIGGWTELQFVNAIKRGVGRRGEHLYPSLPYTSYSLMTTSDVRDLYAYMKTLPAVATPTAPHSLKFPYSFRPTVGAWKAMFFRPKAFEPDPEQSAAWNRGAYLTEGPLHCGECHTPRNALGGPERDRLYAGAPNLEAGGRFANNITQHADGIEDWTQEELASFLQTGMDKCFNEPAGMASVLASTTRLGEADNNAMATYLKSLPPIAGNGEHKTC